MKRELLSKSIFHSGMVWLILTFLFASCQELKVQDWTIGSKLFTLKDPKSTSIKFRNDIEETHEMNVIMYQDFYSGGGVGIGDINNDGLPDVLLTGNTVQYRLYLNKGNFEFERISWDQAYDEIVNKLNKIKSEIELYMND